MISRIFKFTVLICLIALVACGGDKPAKKAIKKAKKEIKAKAEKKDSKDSKEPIEEEREPVPPKQLKKAKELIASFKEGDIDSKRLFKMHCTVCHGLKGNLKINGAKDLSKTKVSLEESVAQVYFGKGLMTPYGKILSNDEIVAVAKYTESLRK